MSARCVWCAEPAATEGVDLHGRSNPLLASGFGDLCDPCDRVNNYLWQLPYLAGVE
ncbi:hypothetical protein [Nocardia ignorata]|uniref:Uncharacterized protein n=1 Tax=Nocardia ignorata TaxID=145285 RepID=A0A4R6NYJ5_NOCIG|nr:hypothetical protein [Nocardia ignorata]TDP29830.1 hypothetical protein DFR75_11298 [Nocardia ignorata]